MARKIYLIGSLRNRKVPPLGNLLREMGHEVFDDWFAAGEKADDEWKQYEQSRGHSYIEALEGLAADHVFQFDKYWLEWADTGVLMLPAGKSGHLELGHYVWTSGKQGFILLDDVDRWDVMYKFATGVCANVEDLLRELEDG